MLLLYPVLKPTENRTSPESVPNGAYSVTGVALFPINLDWGQNSSILPW
jgi:hypothetical protein